MGEVQTSDLRTNAMMELKVPHFDRHYSWCGSSLLFLHFIHICHTKHLIFLLPQKKTTTSDFRSQLSFPFSV